MDMSEISRATTLPALEKGEARMAVALAAESAWPGLAVLVTYSAPALDTVDDIEAKDVEVWSVRDAETLAEMLSEDCNTVEDDALINAAAYAVASALWAELAASSDNERATRGYLQTNMLEAA